MSDSSGALVIPVSGAGRAICVLCPPLPSGQSVGTKAVATASLYQMDPGPGFWADVFSFFPVCPCSAGTLDAMTLYSVSMVSHAIAIIGPFGRWGRAACMLIRTDQDIELTPDLQETRDRERQAQSNKLRICTEVDGNKARGCPNIEYAQAPPCEQPVPPARFTRLRRLRDTAMTTYLA